MLSPKTRDFWKWFRNAFCYVSAWLILLLVGWALVCGAEKVSVRILIAAFCFAAGGSALFYALFVGRLQRRWSFVTRFSLFIAVIAGCETVVFSGLGILDGAAVIPWMIFLAIVAVMYAVSMMIFVLHSRRRATEYTEALHAFQEKMDAQKK